MAIIDGRKQIRNEAKSTPGTPVWMEVPVKTCTECGGQEYRPGSVFGVEHDALCSARLLDPQQHRGSIEEVEREVLRTFYDRAGILMGRSPVQARGALAKLRAWAPKQWPDGFKAKANGAEPGDDKAPLFSEAYLYPLFGKDDARTILALLRAVERALGGEV